MSEELTSADQDRWVEVADGLRQGVERALSKAAEMTPGELGDLARACVNAIELDVSAHSYDAKLHRELSQF